MLKLLQIFAVPEMHITQFTDMYIDLSFVMQSRGGFES